MVVAGRDGDAVVDVRVGLSYRVNAGVPRVPSTGCELAGSLAMARAGVWLSAE